MNLRTDLRRLALGVVYINLGRASPEFPTTNSAHPSYTVFVDLIPPLGLLSPEHRIYFPFEVRWDVWERVVVPLFSEGDVLVKVSRTTKKTLRLEMNRIALLEWGSLLVRVEQDIVRRMEELGWLPVGVRGDWLGSPSPVGSPVVAPGSGGSFLRFD